MSPAPDRFDPLGRVVSGFGPKPNRIMLIGEAPGADEDQQGIPFVGPTGQELRRMLAAIGVKMDECYRTNVFDRRPPGNDLADGYGVARSHRNACLDFGPLTTQPRITFLHSAHTGQIKRLYHEVALCEPNIIIALGNVACWALGLGHGIGNMRGAIHWVEIAGQHWKVMPTFHPSAVVRQWPLRTVVVSDLEKARQESYVRGLRFDNTELWLEPSLDDLREFAERYLENATECAFDVETKQGQITCLSFAPTPDHCLVVPFWVEGDSPHYWSLPDECYVWRWVQHWVEKPSLVKVTQSGMYDTMYLRNPHGMNPVNFSEDTMLMSHSMYSELKKGLGVLASIYCNIPMWKNMRTFKKEEQLKRDD